MSTLPSPAPSTARGQGLGILGGFLLTGGLHVLASIVVVVVGQATQGNEGGLIVLGFWMLIGLAQWVYLLPTGLLARILGFSGVAKGIWIAGALGTLLSALCWGGIGVSSLAGYLVQRASPAAESRPSPRPSPEGVTVVGVITAVDDQHIEARGQDGRVVSALLPPDTKYVKASTTRGRGGLRPATHGLLRPGASVWFTLDPGAPVPTTHQVTMYVADIDSDELCTPGPGCP